MLDFTDFNNFEPFMLIFKPKRAINPSSVFEMSGPAQSPRILNNCRPVHGNFAKDDLKRSVYTCKTSSIKAVTD